MVVLQPLKPGAPRVTLALKRGRARRALSLLGRNDAHQNLQLAESLLTISCEDFAKKWSFDPIRGTPLNGGSFQWTPVPSADAKRSATEEDDLQTCLGVPSLDLPRPESTTKVVAECRLVVASLDTGKPTCVVRASSGHDAPASETSATPASAPEATHTAKATRDNATSESSSTDSSPPEVIAPSQPATPPQEVTAPEEPTPSEAVIATDDASVEGNDTVASNTTNLSLRQTCITDFVRPRKRRSVSLETHYHVPHKKALLQLRA